MVILAALPEDLKSIPSIQFSVTTILEDIIHASGLGRHFIQMVYRQMQAKHNIHKINFKN